MPYPCFFIYGVYPISSVGNSFSDINQRQRLRMQGRGREWEEGRKFALKWRLKNALAPTNRKFFNEISRVSYVCIEESFDTIFNMGYGSGKSVMDERVNIQIFSIL